MQTLFDDLWRLGLRPSKSIDNYVGEIADIRSEVFRSMKAHLDDMRTIVFRVVGEKENG